MKKSNYLLVISAALFFVCFTSATMAQDLLVEIDVSPNVLNLDNSGIVVTVHADIRYASVDHSSVTLNGVPVSLCKYDALGYLVAKFTMSKIRALPLEVNEYNLMCLAGNTKLGVPFEGTQEILVVKKESRGKK